MEQLIVLGTGNAMVTRCYNTCFAISDGAGEYLLVDAGGGNGILAQLEKAGVDLAHIHDMIVTHEHCDHLLGVVWILRKVGAMIQAETTRAACESTATESDCADYDHCGADAAKKVYQSDWRSDFALPGRRRRQEQPAVQRSHFF